MKRWMRALLLVVLLCVSLLPVRAAAAEEEKTMDFVLVVDTSGSTRSSDANKICEEAVRMFVNMVPFENARIAVIAFGNLDRQHPYVFSNEYSKTTDYATYDRYLVHELVPMQEMPDPASKGDVKKLVDQISVYAAQAAADVNDGVNDSHTPMGLATLAAIDLLKVNGAAKGQACVVLMTDGRITSGSNTVTDRALFDKNATNAAVENEWPVYSIELNDDRKNTASSEARQRLTAIAKKTKATFDANGDGSISLEEQGSQVVSDIDDVIGAFQRIIARFCGGNTTTVKADANGIAEHRFEIQELTSEQTIIVYSDGLKKVELLDDDGNVLHTANTDMELEDIIVMCDENHMCIKLICPTPQWVTVRAYTKSMAVIEIYEGSLAGLNLELRSSMPLHNEMTRDTEIPVEAFFTYLDRQFRDNHYYMTSAAPILSVYDSVTDELLASWPMEGSELGYKAKILVGELPEGSYYAEVSLSDKRFEDRVFVSNRLSFACVEQDSCVVAGVEQIEPETVSVGRDFRINLANYFHNPDSTPVTYRLLCNGMEIFATTTEDGIMTVNAGMTPGVYELVLLADDENMEPAKDPRLPMVLTVTDAPIDGDDKVTMAMGIPAILEKWLIPNRPEIPLADLYGDPDGQSILFIECESEDTDIVFVDEETLTLKALKNGSATLTITMSDGVTDFTGNLVVTQRELQVNVRSFLGILLERLVSVLIILAVPILAVIVLLGIKKMNTRFKDYWDFTVEVQNVNIGVQQSSNPIDMPYFGKKKISLAKLVAEGIEPNMDLLAYGTDLEDSKRVAHVLQFWQGKNDMKNVMILPTSRATGFKIVKGKGTNCCEITCGGELVKKRCYVSGNSEVVFHFEENDYALTITMHMAQDQDDRM